jgi:hypothetical protein
MSNQPFDGNLALLIASRSKRSADEGDGGGGGGSAAHMPMPGGDGEMGAVGGGNQLHDMASNFFDCLGEMGKFPTVFADLSEDVLNSIVSSSIAGADSSMLDVLANGFKKMVLNAEMHGLQPVSAVNELMYKGLGTSPIPGFINSKQEGR